MDNYLENMDCEYKYNEEVTISRGLYKDTTGKFKKVLYENEQIFYIIECTIDNKIQRIKCDSSQIKNKLKFKIPFMT